MTERERDIAYRFKKRKDGRHNVYRVTVDYTGAQPDRTEELIGSVLRSLYEKWFAWTTGEEPVAHIADRPHGFMTRKQAVAAIEKLIAQREEATT